MLPAEGCAPSKTAKGAAASVVVVPAEKSKVGQPPPETKLATKIDSTTLSPNGSARTILPNYAHRPAPILRAQTACISSRAVVLAAALARRSGAQDCVSCRRENK